MFYYRNKNEKLRIDLMPENEIHFQKKCDYVRATKILIMHTLKRFSEYENTFTYVKFYVSVKDLEFFYFYFFFLVF